MVLIFPKKNQASSHSYCLSNSGRLLESVFFQKPQSDTTTIVSCFLHFHLFHNKEVGGAGRDLKKLPGKLYFMSVNCIWIIPQWSCLEKNKPHLRILEIRSEVTQVGEQLQRATRNGDRNASYLDWNKSYKVYVFVKIHWTLKTCAFYSMKVYLNKVI